MPERLLNEVAFDKRYLNRYLAVREELAADGQTVLGVIIAFGDSPDEVHAALRRDIKEYGDTRRHFYKPVTGENREGWTIGGND